MYIVNTWRQIRVYHCGDLFCDIHNLHTHNNYSVSFICTVKIITFCVIPTSTQLVAVMLFTNNSDCESDEFSWNTFYVQLFAVMYHHKQWSLCGVKEMKLKSRSFNFWNSLHKRQLTTIEWKPLFKIVSSPTSIGPMTMPSHASYAWCQFLGIYCFDSHIVFAWFEIGADLMNAAIFIDVHTTGS